MKIVTLKFEIVRATSAVAEFVVRAELDRLAAGCEVSGRVVGPRAAGFTTIEMVYPLVPAEVSDNAVSLKCVIPEPSFRTAESPLGYAWSVVVRVNGEATDSRAGTVTFPAPK